MPKITVITEDQFKSASSSGRTLGDRYNYLDELVPVIQGVEVQKGFEVELAEGETKQTVATHVKLAAAVAGREIKTFRGGPNSLKFQVVGETTAKPDPRTVPIVRNRKPKTDEAGNPVAPVARKGKKAQLVEPVE